MHLGSHNLSFLPLLILLPLSTYCGQVPIVDGVTGGVPRVSSTSKRAALVTTPPGAGKLRYVENSGICETTPNVYQASGYGDLTDTDSIWFWYFAARNDPDTAPLSIWLNGGPGSSSMIGLFQENGPCRITNDTTSVVLNPYSWNNASNMLYIDQPVGTGFSRGSIDSRGNIDRVGTSQAAAADLWSFMQIFLKDEKFAQLQNRSLSIWAESYGGHYGPTFAKYILEKNAAISNGTMTGIHLNMTSLAIGNGLTDPLVQYPGYAKYAANNPYRPLASQSLIDSVNESWNKTGGCRDLITACYETPSNSTCSKAQAFCDEHVVEAFGNSTVDFGFNFVPTPSNDSYPPRFGHYLTSVASKIGADTFIGFIESSGNVYDAFAKTGDMMTNSRPDLEAVINAGVRTLLYDGDADFTVNYIGVEAMVDSLNTNFTAQYKTQTFQDYMVAGEKAGLFKQAGGLTYIRVLGAGHEVPAYKSGTLDYGQTAAQMFLEHTVLGQSPESSNATNGTSSDGGVHQSPSSYAHRVTPSLLSCVVGGALLLTLS